MRTAALFAIAVLFSAAALADAPKPEDWYTPETYEDEKNTGMFYYNGGDKEVKLNAKGEIVIDEDLQKIIGKDYRLKMAINAIEATLVNTKQIETLGQNLNDLLILGGIMIADNAGGGSYTVRFGDGTKSIKDVIAAKDGKGNVPATSDRKLADGFTLDWRVDNVDGKEVRSLQLKGARDATSVDNYKSQWFRLGGDAYYLPFLRWGSKPGAGELIWTNFGGFDNTAFGEVPTAKQGTHGVPLTLRGWYTNDFEHTTVTRLMTEDDDDAKDLRKKLQILARKTISDQSSAPDHLTYIPIGDVISGLGLPPDDVSIESYVTEGSTNLAIKGWHAGTASPNVVLANIMLSKAAEGEQPDKEYTVLVRGHDNTLGSNDLYYAAIGDLYKMSWSTNWYDAVKDIVDAEQVVMGQHLTNLVYSAAGDPDTVYNRLVEITKRAENAGDRVDDTYTHLTNLTKSAAGEVDSLYAHITNLTASARDESEKAKSTYAHILALSESADNETDAIFDRITNVMHKAETAQAAADSSYAHLTNLITTAGNPEAVYHHITNLTYETQYTFITNVVEYMQTFENWTYVTNYLVMYMGVEQKKGDGPVAPPPVDKKDDPYDGGYEHDPVKDSLLPVKTALIVNDATNKPMETIKAEHMFDFDVIDTNAVPVSGEVRYLAQLRGFYAADASSTPKIPVKRKKTDIQRPAGEADYDPERTTNYALDWMDYPTALFGATTNDLAKVTEYLKKYNITNILHTVVSNNEWLTEMSTNFFNRVKAEKMLDNDTIWTNGENMVEIKGYRDERTQLYTSPFINWVPTNGTPDHVRRMTWEPLPIADDEAASRFSAWVDSTIESTTNAVTISEEDPVPAKILSLHGFESAKDGQVPYKYIVDPEEVDPAPVTTHIGNRLSWKYAFDRALKFKGTDGSSYTVGPACSATNTVTFASASDSNVHVHVAEDQNNPGSVTITIGVYYLTESNLSGGNSGESGL